MTTFKNIVKISKEIKEYIEKNHELPKTVVIDKVTYTYPQIGYLLSKSVQKPNTEIKSIKVSAAPKPTGETVTLKLEIDDYKKIAKNLSDFITKHGRLPNYLTYKSKKIKQRVYIYAFAKIIVFYNTKGRLPSSCKFYTSETVAASAKKSSSSSSKSKNKYGHASKSGCDNRGQNTSVYCGCHSLQEVFRNLTGIVVPQSTIAKVCGTTSSGTDHNGLNTCVVWFNKKYGFNLKVEWKNFSDLGWTGVKKIVNSDNKDCIIHNLYRNKWGHYEVINSVSDSNIKVQNSLGNKCSAGCYCGYVENRPPATFRSYIAGISQKSVMIITKN